MDELPNVIFLIREGDEWVWCDDPAPTDDHDPFEAVKYKKADIIEGDKNESS